MKHLYLAPRSNETAYKNYISSMQGIEKSTLIGYFDENDKEQLKDIETIHAWGCQPSLESKWAGMRFGDYVLFYAKGRFVSIGELIFKKKSAPLALALWPRNKDTNEPWSCVFFVDKLVQIDLPLEDFNELTGYELPSVMGFMPVRKGMEKLEERFGDIEGFVESLKSGLVPADINEIASFSKSNLSNKSLEDLAKFDELTRRLDDRNIEEVLRQHAEAALGSTPEKVAKVTQTYKRNRQLVKDIKAKYSNECQICGFTFKMANGAFYSEAAHIIPISSHKAGVDSPDNIWVLCANHHKMLDTHAIDAVSRTQYRYQGAVHDLKLK